MQKLNDRVVDWLAPRSVRYVAEVDLSLMHPVAMLEESPYTGTVLRCEDGLVVEATSFVDGEACENEPFPILLKHETPVPTYCELPDMTDSGGAAIDLWGIMENESAPFIDGNRIEGLLLFVDPGGTVLFSFSRTGIFENLWLDGDMAVKYTGSIGSSRETAQATDYLWDDSGRISEYSYIDNTRGESCELHTDSDFKLRGLDVSGRTTLHSDAPRHEFDRFGSLRRIEQLEGLSFGDYLFLRGNGVDERVLDYLLTLLPDGRPKKISCALDLGAPPQAIACFLAAAATDTVNLTRYRLPDPALLATVRDELHRLRPDLSIEST